MPLTSGYSIQRNEIVTVQHRLHTETQVASGSPDVELKTMIDFSEKNWEWDVTVDGTKRSLNRTSGNNILNSASAITDKKAEIALWFNKDVTKIYTEGDITDDIEVLEFDQSIGKYGGLKFRYDFIPLAGSVISISYRESTLQWVGNGGLLHQLATDMCVHPYDVPELGIIKPSDYQSGSANFEIPLNTLGYLDDVAADSVSTQRKIKLNATSETTGLWRVVRGDTYVWNAKIKNTGTAKIEEIKASGGSGGSGLIEPTVGVAPNLRVVHMGGYNLTAATVNCFIPYTMSDLGNGRFVLTVNGRVLPNHLWYAESTSETSATSDKRYTEFVFIGDVLGDLSWVSSTGTGTAATVDVSLSISFIWEYSTLKQYGALVGPFGFSPQQEDIVTDHSFINVAVYVQPTATARGTLTVPDTSFAVDDIILLEYDAGTGRGFDPAFKLIYPPTSLYNESIELSCDEITNLFIVESTGAVDLLSMETQYGLTQHVPGGLKSQKWRIRFEWLSESSELKVNVATKYQIKDDGTITRGQSRDGVMSGVFRLPGELCDVYQEPVLSRHVNVTEVKNKSHWFRRNPDKSTYDVKNTYPISYKLTTTDHGVALFIWEQSSADIDTEYSWFVVQRHVDQITGQPDVSGKTPLHCVYSPSKRPIKFEGLNQYYASSDVEDLSPSPIIYDASGRPLRNPSTINWISNDTVFDGYVNAIDFFGKGYNQTLSPVGAPFPNVAGDLTTGPIANILITPYSDYWSSSVPLTFNTHTYVSFLHLQGYQDLPRHLGNNIWTVESSLDVPMMVPPYLDDNSISYSGNLVFSTNTPERMSKYEDITKISSWCEDASSVIVNAVPNTKDGCEAVSGQTWIPSSIPDAKTGAVAEDFKSIADSLVDFLSPHNKLKKKEILNSMVVSLNDNIIEIDKDAYILTYHDWYTKGDPNTIPRFLESLDINNVDAFLGLFRLPMYAEDDYNNPLETMTQALWTAIFNDPAVAPATVAAGSCNQQGLYFAFNPTVTAGFNSTIYLNKLYHDVKTFTNFDPKDFTTNSWTANTFVTSTLSPELRNKLPGDVIFSSDSVNNKCFYDFENKSLYFLRAPNRGTKLSIAVNTYSSMDNYLIKTVQDRDFTQMEEDNYMTINRFVVRESDILKPWDFHVSATRHGLDSYAIINPYEQLSITDDRNFVFAFPTQLTSHRFYYPTGELDMICISSADFSSLGGHIEIDKYGDSDGVDDNVYVHSSGLGDWNPTLVTGSDPFPYAGHVDQVGDAYYWTRNIRKYEGMSATLPNGNGMRVFVQVTGSSIRHSDVQKREFT